MTTIATHNGSKVHQAHNRRDQRCVAKENHIQVDGWHENWVDVPVKKAYHDLFDEAVKEYNEKQAREDRKIQDYYKKIESDAKKHPCYEMIAGVYGEHDRAVSYAVLRQFVEEWQRRNPNLELIGAYFHADEQGKQPHVHLDYIPVAHGYKRGMKTQTGLVKALEEQGFIKKGKETAQIQWERQENKALEEICRQHYLKIEHPQSGSNIAHLHKKEYIATQKAVVAEKHLDGLETSIAVAKEQKLEALRERDQARVEKDYFKALKEATEAVEEYAEIEVLNRTEARGKSLFNQSKPATVTIKEEEFEAMKDIQKAYNEALDLLYKLNAITCDYKEAAEKNYKNKIDGYRESYAKDTVALKRENIMQEKMLKEARSTVIKLQNRIEDLTKNVADLMQDKQNIEKIVEQNPDLWTRFIEEVEERMKEQEKWDLEL